MAKEVGETPAKKIKATEKISINNTVCSKSASGHCNTSLMEKRPASRQRVVGDRRKEMSHKRVAETDRCSSGMHVRLWFMGSSRGRVLGELRRS